MALSREILDESELAKAKIAGNSNLDDDYKKALLSIINITTVATNGISPEEKIQKMTEAIHMLAVSQIQFVTGVQDIIEKAILTANRSQCQNCKAMKHTETYDERQKNEEIIAQWKKQHQDEITQCRCHEHDEDCDAGRSQDSDFDCRKSWSDIAKETLTKPYIYVLAIVTIVSPYGVQILDKILNFCAR